LHGLFFSAIDLTANWLKNRHRNNNGSHELVEILEKILRDQVSRNIKISFYRV